MFYHQGALLTQEYLKSGHGVIGLQGRTSHHLYITTDDEIEDGDWFILDNEEVLQADRIKNTNLRGKVIYSGQVANDYKLCNKIIATTDPELYNRVWKGMIEGEDWYEEEYLPQPSKAFIEKFCKEGGIDEVDVEYGLFHDGNFKEDDETHAFKATRKPRVNSHNEITIHPVKDSWTMEDLPDLLSRFCKDHSLHRGLQITDGMIREWLEKQ